MNEDHYRQLFAAMQEAVLVAELVEQPGTPDDFRYIDANPAVERILGIPRAHIIGRTSRELIPDIQEDLVEMCARVVRTGVSETREVFEPLVQQHHHSVFFRPAPGQVAVVFTDVTEHKRTEASLLETAARFSAERERFELLVSSIDDHLVSYDHEWRFTFDNEAAARVLGHPREQLLGRSIWDLFPEAVGNDYHNALHAAARERRVIRLEHYYPPLGRWFDNHIYPSAEGVTVFASDITARKHAEAALRESEERFRVMADGLPLIVWVHAADGSQEFVNDRGCEFFGVTREQMRGLRWECLVHPDDYGRYVGGFRAALTHQTPFHEVARVRRADGEWRWVESWGRPRFAGTGAFTGMVAASADVTDHLATEQALRDADRRKDEFLATLAHELRNPLAAITSAAELLRTAGPGASTAPSALRILDRQVRHMARQVDDLLDATRISNGQIQLRRERIDAADVLDHALEAAGLQTAARGARFDVRRPSMPLYIDGDPTRLAQVVGNLLNNAVKFGGDEPIAVSLAEEDGRAVLRVRDGGIGIPNDQLERIFDMFVQLDPPRERSLSGLGIGLSLVRSIVTGHGGTVTAHSAGVGSGSEFTVALPLAARSNSAEEAVAPAASSAPRRVLVVDDNQDAADMLARLLAQDGHDVAVAYSGHAALERAETFRPEFVLLDLGMPRLNGLDTARQLRARYPGMRLVALTGWGEEADRRRSMAAGFDAHLVKPASLEDLHALLTDERRASL